jgi:hypothetical protein
MVAHPTGRVRRGMQMLLDASSFKAKTDPHKVCARRHLPHPTRRRGSHPCPVSNSSSKAPWYNRHLARVRGGGTHNLANWGTIPGREDLVYKARTVLHLSIHHVLPMWVSIPSVNLDCISVDKSEPGRKDGVSELTCLDGNGVRSGTSTCWKPSVCRLTRSRRPDHV